MRKIKKVKIKIVKKPDICIGDHFVYKDIKWICLDIIDGNYLAITAKVWQELPFDFGNHNNWKESSLRRMLNYKFLDKLNKEHLVMQTSDLIADNGDKSYGTSEDYVTILSCDQYRKYRALVPCYPERMWTHTDPVELLRQPRWHRRHCSPCQPDRQHQRLQCLLRLRSRPGVFVFVKNIT